MPTREPVRDQSVTNDCVLESGARAGHLFLGGHGIWVPFADPLVPYKLVRGNGRSGPLTDDGCLPTEAVSVMSTVGMVPETTPFDPATVNDPVDLQTIQDAAAWKIAGWRRMPAVGAELVDEICDFLDEGIPVIFGMDLEAGYEQWNGRGVYVRDDAAPSVGLHMQTIVGYEVTDQGVVFWVVNSWGAVWGDGGFARIAAQSITRWCADFYALNAEPAGPGGKIVSAT